MAAPRETSPRETSKVRLVFVTPRFRAGDATLPELLAAELADRAPGGWRTTVLTTTAAGNSREPFRDGEIQEKGVRVVRFPAEVPSPSGSDGQAAPDLLRSSDLVEHLRDKSNDYDLVVLFGSSPVCLEAAKVDPGRTVLLPFIDEEAVASSDSQIFRHPAAFVFGSEAEEVLILKRYQVHRRMRETIAGALLLPRTADRSAFRQRTGLTGHYLLSAGPLEPGRGGRGTAAVLLHVQRPSSGFSSGTRVAGTRGVAHSETPGHPGGKPQEHAGTSGCCRRGPGGRDPGAACRIFHDGSRAIFPRRTDPGERVRDGACRGLPGLGRRSLLPELRRVRAHPRARSAGPVPVCPDGQGRPRVPAIPARLGSGAGALRRGFPQLRPALARVRGTRSQASRSPSRQTPDTRVPEREVEAPVPTSFFEASARRPHPAGRAFLVSEGESAEGDSDESPPQPGSGSESEPATEASEGSRAEASPPDESAETSELQAAPEGRVGDGRACGFRSGPGTVRI